MLIATRKGGEYMSKHNKKTEVDMPLAVMTMLKANVMAYVVTAIFVLFASILLTYTQVDAQFESIIVILGIIASAFLSGFDTAKIEDRNGYKWGAVGGSLYFMIFLVLGTLIEKLNNVAPSMIFLIAFIVLITSTIAGMISVNCRG